MAKLGKLIGTSAEGLRGALELVHGRVAIELVPDLDTNGAEGAPTHEINVKRGGEGGAFNIGAAWKFSINRGDFAGRSGFSLEIDHPEFPQMRASAFPINDREYLIRTDRPRQQEGA